MTATQVTKTRKAFLKQLAQHAAMRGITHQQLADATGLERPNVTRTLAGNVNPGLDILIKLAHAVGLRITLG